MSTHLSVHNGFACLRSTAPSVFTQASAAYHAFAQQLPVAQQVPIAQQVSSLPRNNPQSLRSTGRITTPAVSTSIGLKIKQGRVKTKAKSSLLKKATYN